MDEKNTTLQKKFQKTAQALIGFPDELMPDYKAWAESWAKLIADMTSSGISVHASTTETNAESGLCDPTQRMCSRFEGDFGTGFYYLATHVYALLRLIDKNKNNPPYKKVLERELRIAVQSAKLRLEIDTIGRKSNFLYHEIAKIEANMLSLKSQHRRLQPMLIQAQGWEKRKKITHNQIAHIQNQINENQKEIRQLEYRKQSLKKQIDSIFTQHASNVIALINQGETIYPGGWTTHAVYISLKPAGRNYTATAFNLGGGVPEALKHESIPGLYYACSFPIAGSDIGRYLVNLAYCKIYGETDRLSEKDAVEFTYNKFEGLAPLRGVADREQSGPNCIVKNYLFGLRIRLGDENYKKMYLDILKTVWADFTNKSLPSDAYLISAIQCSEQAFSGVEADDLKRHISFPRNNYQSASPNFTPLSSFMTSSCLAQSQPLTLPGSRQQSVGSLTSEMSFLSIQKLRRGEAFQGSYAQASKHFQSSFPSSAKVEEFEDEEAFSSVLDSKRERTYVAKPDPRNFSKFNSDEESDEEQDEEFSAASEVLSYR